MPVDTTSLVEMMREIYGPRMEDILFRDEHTDSFWAIPETTGTTTVHLTIDMLLNTIRNNEMAFGINPISHGKRSSKEFSPIEPAKYDKIQFEEEWV